MQLLGRLILKYGVVTGLLLFLKINLSNGTISLPGLRAPIVFRKGTTDFTVLHSVILADAYKLKLGFQPAVIIDAGANVGYASVAFANLYPDARIFAIEPDDANFAVLKQNTRAYSNVQCIKAGLWPRACKLHITNATDGSWAFRVAELPESAPEGIPTVTIPALMEEHQIDEIGILKMDIEGSEKDIFEAESASWLSRTRCLIVEVHDGFRKGSSKAVFLATTRFDFSFKRSGENLVFVRDTRSDPRARTV